MARKTVNLHWPAAGLNKSHAYGLQPPYSTPSALNCRPDSVRGARDRGGSRPGTGKAFPLDVLGSGNPVRLLAQTTYIKADGLTFWEDFFKGTSLGAIWSTASWIGTAPSILPETLASIGYGTSAGVVRSALTSLDTARAYTVELFINPFEGAHHGDYQVYLRMNDTTPVVTTDGILVTFTITGATGVYSGTAKRYSAGSLSNTYTMTGGTEGTPQAGWLRCHLNGTTLVVSWNGTQILSQVIAAPAAGGSRVGFGMTCSVAGGITLVDTFRSQYYETTNRETQRSILFASSNGSMYRENFLGDLDILSVSPTLASDRQLMATDRLQKLYIADNGDARVIGTAGVTNGAGTLLDDAAVTDWTALGIDVDDDVVVIASGTGATAGTYKISTIHATNGLTLTTSAGASASAIAYRVERAPKIFNPADDTVVIWTATTGQVPSGCPLICLYRDRLVLAKDHIWHMSRQGDPLDFNYGADADDTGRAVAGTNTTAGRIGAPINAMVPHSDDYLVFGCDAALWVLRGDPAAFGQIDNLSRNVGIVDRRAWCKGPSGELIFLSRDGLYMLPPGAAGTPGSVSRERLPQELLDYSKELFTCSLAYDFRDRGIHIFLTHKVSMQNTHYWFDWEAKSFWPVQIPTVQEPTTILEYTSASAEHSCVLLGGRDGYLRRFDSAFVNDDATAITSYVWLGPLKLGSDQFHDGQLMELVATLGDSSGEVDWSLYVGDSAEQAFNAQTAMDSGTWAVEGKSYLSRPMIRGAAAYLKLANGDSHQPWFLEEAAAVIVPRGTHKVM